MVQPDTRAGVSYINSKMENMKNSQFKYDTPKSKLQIVKQINTISDALETYSEIVWNKFNLYYTSSCPLFKDYMETRRSELEEENELTS